MAADGGTAAAYHGRRLAIGVGRETNRDLPPRGQTSPYPGHNGGGGAAAIENGTWRPSADGRFRSRLEFSHDREWNGKEYAIKAVEPIFAELRHKIVVVTVYTYYYNEQERHHEDNL